jgi:hypothetical protein
MKPELVVVPDDNKESDMRTRIKEVYDRANPVESYDEYWNVLKCQQDRQFLLECVQARLGKSFTS